MDEEELLDLLKNNRIMIYNRNIAPASGRTMAFNLPSGAPVEVDVFRKQHGIIRSFELRSATAFATWYGDGEPVASELSNYPTDTLYNITGSPQRLFLYQDSGAAILVKIVIWSD